MLTLGEFVCNEWRVWNMVRCSSTDILSPMFRPTSVLRERFKNMEEIHRKHDIQLDDGLSQDDGDGNFTQGTSVSRMSFGTTFTTSTTNTHAITREDMDAFQRALDAKFSDLSYEFVNAKKKHRDEEDAIQREIAELQAKKATVDNGEIPKSSY